MTLCGQVSSWLVARSPFPPLVARHDHEIAQLPPGSGRPDPEHPAEVAQPQQQAGSAPRRSFHEGSPARQSAQSERCGADADGKRQQRAFQRAPGARRGGETGWAASVPTLLPSPPSSAASSRSWCTRAREIQAELHSGDTSLPDPAFPARASSRHRHLVPVGLGRLECRGSARGAFGCGCVSADCCPWIRGARARSRSCR